MVPTLCFYCRAPGFNPWLGTKILLTRLKHSQQSLEESCEFRGKDGFIVLCEHIIGREHKKEFTVPCALAHWRFRTRDSAECAVPWIGSVRALFSDKLLRISSACLPLVR